MHNLHRDILTSKDNHFCIVLWCTYRQYYITIHRLLLRYIFTNFTETISTKDNDDAEQTQAYTIYGIPNKVVL